MSKLREAEKLHRTVECPRCGALPGRACFKRAPTGSPLSHAARRVYATTGKEPFKFWFRRTLREGLEKNK